MIYKTANPDTGLNPGPKKKNVPATSSLSQPPALISSWVAAILIILLMATKNCVFLSFDLCKRFPRICPAITPSQIVVADIISQMENVLFPIIGGVLIGFKGFRVTLLGIVTVVLTGHVLFTIGNSTSSSILVVIGRLFFGLANQSMYVIAVYMAATLFPKKNIGKAIGLVFSMDFGTYLLWFNLLEAILTKSKSITAASICGNVLAGVCLLFAIFAVLLIRARERSMQNPRNGDDYYVDLGTREEETRRRHKLRWRDFRQIVQVEFLMLMAIYAIVNGTSVEVLIEEYRFLLVTRCSMPIDVWMSYIYVFLIASMVLSFIIGVFTDWMGKRTLIITAGSVMSLVVFIFDYLVIKSSANSCDDTDKFWFPVILIGMLSGIMYTSCMDTARIMLKSRVLAVGYGFLFGCFGLIETVEGAVFQEIAGTTKGIDYQVSYLSTLNGIFIAFGVIAVICAVIINQRFHRSRLEAKAHGAVAVRVN